MLLDNWQNNDHYVIHYLMHNQACKTRMFELRNMYLSQMVDEVLDRKPTNPTMWNDILNEEVLYQRFLESFILIRFNLWD